MGQRYEYKTVANMWNEVAYTEAHKESDTKLMNSIFDQIKSDVAASRDMTTEEVRALVDRAPFLGREALDARLVDGFKFWDEVEALMEEKSGTQISLVKPAAYVQNRLPEIETDGDYVIGLVYGEGEVVRGDSSSSLTGGTAMASRDFVKIFQQIRDDGDVNAVVFRVNSPGGSPDASATIDHEIQLTRKAGIPVIVSMGDVAASGGYYVAMHADHIVAQPLTLTGSIGVAGGKFVIRDLLERVGVTTDEIHIGENALMLSMNIEPNASQMERFNALMDRIYKDFIEGVMEGRNLTSDQIDAVARGRVWTGVDALEVGLVDTLGGLFDALDKAREMMGVPDGTETALRIYPRPKTFFEMLKDPEAGFFMRLHGSLKTFIQLMNVVENAAGSDIRKLNRVVSSDLLGAQLDARGVPIEAQ